MIWSDCTIREKSWQQKYKGLGDKKLKALAVELTEVLIIMKDDFKESPISLSKSTCRKLAHAFIEFAEDLHNDIGLWKSVESFNKEIYGTPLPMIVKDADEISELYDVNRFRYYLHNVIPDIFHNVFLAPNDRFIQKIAENVSAFLSYNMKDVPQDSGLKKFYKSIGYDYHRFRDLSYWAAEFCFLFRFTYDRWDLENKKDHPGAIVFPDQILVNGSSCWSGIGIAEILARGFGFTAKTVEQVKTWRNSPYAIYEVISFNKIKIVLKNLINNQQCTAYNYFAKDKSDIGSYIGAMFIPFRRNAYFLGMGSKLANASDMNEVKRLIVENYIADHSGDACLFNSKLLGVAKQILKVKYDIFIKTFGSDFIVFDQPSDMEEALEKFEDSCTQAVRKVKIRMGVLKDKGMKESPEVHDFHKKEFEEYHGQTLFFNKNLGIETMGAHYAQVHALKKKGNNLVDDDRKALALILTKECVSPQYVDRLIADYGDETIFRFFNMRKSKANLDYIYRKYKWRFYMNPMPRISLRNVSV